MLGRFLRSRGGAISEKIERPGRVRVRTWHRDLALAVAARRAENLTREMLAVSVARIKRTGCGDLLCEQTIIEKFGTRASSMTS